MDSFKQALVVTAVKKLVEIVEVDNDFAVITDAHEFAKLIKKLKELTHV